MLMGGPYISFPTWEFQSIPLIHFTNYFLSHILYLINTISLFHTLCTFPRVIMSYEYMVILWLLREASSSKLWVGESPSESRGRKGSSRWALFLMIILSLAMPSSNTTPRRVNLVISFEGMWKVGTVYEFWPNTFQVDIPTLIDFARPKVRCHNSTISLCHTIRNAGDKLVDIRLNYLRHLQETSAIKLMSSSQETQSRSRSKIKLPQTSSGNLCNQINVIFSGNPK